MSANPGTDTYRTIWRWHFYAGLFCVPFVIWAAVTGSIYLFKPQIEAWLDRTYDNLTLSAPPAAAADHIRAAMAAVPGATFVAYELPRAPQSAVRVVMGQGARRYRVYVHPATTEVLHVLDEDTRPMRRVFYLHGELMMGRIGSTIVELAASWAVIMLLTGLFLWWPRQGNWMLGVIIPRLWKGGRMFWRDLHAVTGVWVIVCALFLIATGLPWAENWGGYLRWVREATGATAADRHWHTSHSEELAERLGISNAMAAAAFAPGRGPMPSFDSIDRMVAAVTPLGLAHPVLITPPMTSGGPWGALSDAPNRTLRTRIQLDPESAQVLFRDDFAQWHWIDRVVGFGIAVHEGQYFGIANQLLALVTTTGLVLLSLSGVMMWWRRRPEGLLGAPRLLRESRLSRWLVIPAVLLGVYLPLFALSAVLVLSVEHLVLRRIPRTRDWLGLDPMRAS